MMPDFPNPICRFIGCDVGKTALVFSSLGETSTQTIQNTKAAISGFISKLDTNCLVVCEATGGHEALLLSCLAAADIPAHRADARKVKAFIRSYGVLGKTDDIDAKQLALYASERHNQLALWQEPNPNAQDLQSLILTRQDLVADRVAWNNRLKAPGTVKGTTAAAPRIKAMLKAIKAQIAAIERDIAATIKASKHLTQTLDVLSTIKGVGITTAATIIALMPELGTMDRRQAAALAGLAPHPKQSGATNAYRRTKGGRPNVKKAIFMAAMSASKHNPQLKPAYQRLINAGKKPIVALTAIMRKLIVIANAKIRDLIKTNNIQLS
jgi:transposase